MAGGRSARGPEGPSPVSATPPHPPPPRQRRGWGQPGHGGTARGGRGLGQPLARASPPSGSPVFSRWVQRWLRGLTPLSLPPSPAHPVQPDPGCRVGPFSSKLRPKSNCAISSLWPPPALSLPARGQPRPCPARGAPVALRPHVPPAAGTAPCLLPAWPWHGVLATASLLARCAPAWPGAGDYSWRCPGLCTCPQLNCVPPISGCFLQV